MGASTHVGKACNAYADAVATAAYLGNNDTHRGRLKSGAGRGANSAMHVHGAKGGGREHREEGDSGPTDVWAQAQHMHNMCQSAHKWVCEQYRKTVRPGSHTAGVAGRLWSEVAVASLKHPWHGPCDNKMRLPDENLRTGKGGRHLTI